VKRELRKVVRPLIAVVIGIGVLLQVVFAFTYVSAAETNYAPWVGDVSRLDDECDRSENACLAELASAREQAAYVAEDFRLASVMQTPLGMVGVAAGNFASFIGALIVAAIASTYVGGEWSGRTISSVLVRDPDRRRLAMRQFSIVLIVALAALLVSILVLALVSLLLDVAFDVTPPVGDLDVSAWAVDRLSTGFLVVVAFAAVGVLFGHVARRPFGAFLLFIGAVVGFHAAALVDGLYIATPVYWIASWMELVPGGALADHAWLDRFPLLAESAVPAAPAVWTGVALALLAVGALGASIRRLVSRDIAQ
jgi:hypothetical protein